MRDIKFIDQNNPDERPYGMVIAVIKRHFAFLIPTADFEDAVSEGFLGIAKAKEKFDPTKISKHTGKPICFSTYAWVGAYRYIQEYIRKRKLLYLHEQILKTDGIKEPVAKLYFADDITDERYLEFRDRYLSERYRKLLDLLERGYSQSEIGKEFHVTKSRAGQLVTNLRGMASKFFKNERMLTCSKSK